MDRSYDAETRLQRRRTLRNLRTAAIQLMSEHGYGAMNLRMLAKKVGIQASSLYNYIESKQQLLFLLCEETTDKLGWPNSNRPSARRRTRQSACASSSLFI